MLALYSGDMGTPGDALDWVHIKVRKVICRKIAGGGGGGGQKLELGQYSGDPFCVWCGTSCL